MKSGGYNDHQRRDRFYEANREEQERHEERRHQFNMESMGAERIPPRVSNVLTSPGTGLSSMEPHASSQQQQQQQPVIAMAGCLDRNVYDAAESSVVPAGHAHERGRGIRVAGASDLFVPGGGGGGGVNAGAHLRKYPHHRPPSGCPSASGHNGDMLVHDKNVISTPKLQEDDQGGIDPSWAPVNFGSRGSDARHEQQQQHDARSFGIGAQGRAIPIRSRLANGGAGDGWRLTGARNFGEGSSGGGGDNNADHGVYTTPLARQMPLVNEAGQPGNYRQQFEYRGHRDRSDEYSRKQGRSNQQDHMLLGGHQRQDEQLLKAIAMSEIALPPPASRDRSNALRNVTPETGPAAVVDTGTSAVNGGAWAPSTGTARHHHARAASTSASISTAGSPQGSGASDRIGPENKRQVHRYAKRARKPRAPYRCRRCGQLKSRHKCPFKFSKMDVAHLNLGLRGTYHPSNVVVNALQSAAAAATPLSGRQDNIEERTQQPDSFYDSLISPGERTYTPAGRESAVPVDNACGGRIGANHHDRTLGMLMVSSTPPRHPSVQANQRGDSSGGGRADGCRSDGQGGTGSGPSSWMDFAHVRDHPGPPVAGDMNDQPIIDFTVQGQGGRQDCGERRQISEVQNQFTGGPLPFDGGTGELFNGCSRQTWSSTSNSLPGQAITPALPYHSEVYRWRQELSSSSIPTSNGMATSSQEYTLRTRGIDAIEAGVHSGTSDTSSAHGTSSVLTPRLEALEDFVFGENFKHA